MSTNFTADMVKGFRGFARVRPPVMQKTAEQYKTQARNVAGRKIARRLRIKFRSLPMPEGSAGEKVSLRTSTFGNWWKTRRRYRGNTNKKRKHQPTEELVVEAKRYNPQEKEAPKSFWQKFKNKIRRKRGGN